MALVRHLAHDDPPRRIDSEIIHFGRTNHQPDNAHAAAAASSATGRGHEPRPVPGPLTERSDLMTQKICFDCFHKLFPDKPIRKVTLGRQCVVCKAQTDRTEQMIPVEAEDIPLVKQIAQVPRRVLHRTERHADRRVAVRVAARGAGQVGRDAGQAGPRDPRHVRAMSADLDKAEAEGVELSTAATASNQ